MTLQGSKLHLAKTAKASCMDKSNHGSGSLGSDFPILKQAVSALRLRSGGQISRPISAVLSASGRHTERGGYGQTSSGHNS